MPRCLVICWSHVWEGPVKIFPTDSLKHCTTALILSNCPCHLVLDVKRWGGAAGVNCSLCSEHLYYHLHVFAQHFCYLHVQDQDEFFKNLHLLCLASSIELIYCILSLMKSWESYLKENKLIFMQSACEQCQKLELDYKNFMSILHFLKKNCSSIK